METIENLILDFGGVLLDLDERATYEAFVALGLERVPPELTAVNLDFQRFSNATFLLARPPHRSKTPGAQCSARCPPCDGICWNVWENVIACFF